MRSSTSDFVDNSTSLSLEMLVKLREVLHGCLNVKLRGHLFHIPVLLVEAR